MNSSLQNLLADVTGGLLHSISNAKVAKSNNAKIAETAKEFEAALLSMMLKELRTSSEAESGMFPGDTGDVHGGMFDMLMGKHLAQSGGFGLAASLEHQLRRNSDARAHSDGNPSSRGSTARSTQP